MSPMYKHSVINIVTICTKHMTATYWLLYSITDLEHRDQLSQHGEGYV